MITDAALLAKILLVVCGMQRQACMDRVPIRGYPDCVDACYQQWRAEVNECNKTEEECVADVGPKEKRKKAKQLPLIWNEHK